MGYCKAASVTPRGAAGSERGLGLSLTPRQIGYDAQDITVERILGNPPNHTLVLRMKPTRCLERKVEGHQDLKYLFFKISFAVLFLILKRPYI